MQEPFYVVNYYTSVIAQEVLWEGELRLVFILQKFREQKHIYL